MFGIEVPIIPGLMPVVNAESIPRIAKMSGASFPESLMREVQARASDPDAVVELAVAFTALQADELLRHGAPGIHFYTLNRSPATSAIVSALRLIRPWEVHNYAESPASHRTGGVRSSVKPVGTLAMRRSHPNAVPEQNRATRIARRVRHTMTSNQQSGRHFRRLRS